MCPECIPNHYQKGFEHPIQGDAIGLFQDKVDDLVHIICKQGHLLTKQQLFGIVERHLAHDSASPTLSVTIKCLQHRQATHDFFLSYKSATDKQAAYSVYASLSLRKRKQPEPVRAFLDDKCLNYGQPVDMFIHWLLNSQVVVLLISMDGLNMMSKRAPNKQDNALLEYETALVQQELTGVPVIPVFFGNRSNELQSGIFRWFEKHLLRSDKSLSEYKAFKISGAEQMFPDLPHRRSDAANKLLASLLDKAPFPDYLRSIRATMECILQMRGWRSRRGLDAEELKDLTDVLMNTLPE